MSKNNYGQDDFLAAYRAWLVPGVIIILTLIGLVYFLVFAGGPLKNIQRDNIKESHQYIESTRAQINTIVAEIGSIDVKIAELKNDPGSADVVSALKGHRLAEINRMTELCGNLSQAEIPQGAKQYLSTQNTQNK